MSVTSQPRQLWCVHLLLSIDKSGISLLHKLKHFWLQVRSNFSMWFLTSCSSFSINSLPVISWTITKDWSWAPWGRPRRRLVCNTAQQTYKAKRAFLGVGWTLPVLLREVWAWDISLYSSRCKFFYLWLWKTSLKWTPTEMPHVGYQQWGLIWNDWNNVLSLAWGLS